MFPVLARLLIRLLLASMAVAGVSATAAPPPPDLVLSEARPQVDVWPAARMLVDPGGTLDWQTALARWPEFAAPEGPQNNLGIQREPVWLAWTLRVADGDGQWVFDLDYPAFNEARLFLVVDGRVHTEFTVGSTLAYEARPMRSRTHAAPLSLTPGRSYQVLVRLKSDSAMVLPLTLSKLGHYHEREARRLVAQGLMFGMAAALLAYCVVNGLSLRNPLFALYGTMLVGSAAFFLDYSGLGQQFLWSQRSGMTAMVSPLSVLLAMAAGGPFVMRALETRLHSPWLHRGLVVLSSAAALLLAAGLAGLLTYRQAQVMATAIGPFVPLLAIPAAWRRARRGERIARYMLLGWGSYVVGAVTTACLLRGLLPGHFWAMHLFQWASLFEMLAWLQVLGLHTEGGAARRRTQRRCRARPLDHRRHRCPDRAAEPAQPGPGAGRRAAARRRGAGAGGVHDRPRRLQGRERPPGPRRRRPAAGGGRAAPETRDAAHRPGGPVGW